MSLTLIAMAAAAATHNVQVEHRGKPVEAVYSAQTDIRTRTIGAHTPNRADSRRCLWTATIMVDRKLAHGPALSRILSHDREISGSTHGACAPDNKQVVRDVAKRQDIVRDHLLAVAQQDRGVLLAELDAVQNMASN
ncbi:MAG TPA: hypothetical protein VF509_02605 [Sphingobium sp.]